ncbi:MAG: hypothetical protein FJ265_19845 [Planctomycetes bacterium]|nr:hypothetical protein [Planctomycetota bacterium]
MTHHACAASVPHAHPAPPPLPAAHGTGSFPAIAALGAALAAFLTWQRQPDLLTTTIAAGLTFLGALIGLHVLHFVFRVIAAVGKFVLPIAALLLIGCALDWPWAERAVDWIWHAGRQGLHVAEQGWVTLRAR